MENQEVVIREKIEQLVASLNVFFSNIIEDQDVSKISELVIERLETLRAEAERANEILYQS